MTHRVESTTTYKDGFGFFFSFSISFLRLSSSGLYGIGIVTARCGVACGGVEGGGTSVGYLFIFYSGV